MPLFWINSCPRFFAVPGFLQPWYYEYTEKKNYIIKLNNNNKNEYLLSMQGVKGVQIPPKIIKA